MMNKLSHVVYTGIQIFAMCLIVGNAHAALYKWVDDSGGTHYSSNRPAGVVVEEIQPPPKVDTEAANKQLEAQQKQAADLEGRRKAKAENKQIAKQNAKIKKKNCETAKARLASYARPSVRLVQEDGSRLRLTEEQRQKQIAISNEMIKEYCN
jgi:uncharacterized protein DUF4124